MRTLLVILIAFVRRLIKNIHRPVMQMINKSVTILLTLLVKIYQIGISPFIGNRCRYVPSCSSYAIEALESHGAICGSVLAARRICRCHPWASGGYDPVPQHLNSLKPDDE